MPQKSEGARAKENARKRRWRAANGEHRRAWERQYREDNRARLTEYHRKRHIKTTYGLDSDQYDAMVAQQGGLCAICRDTPPTAVDHDHETGAVRGLLCTNCNSGIGKLRDDASLLRAAATYLEKE